MESGIMWLDNDEKVEITIKLNNAAKYYFNRYGCRPDICFVHPSMLPEGLSLYNGIRLIASSAIIPFHFWIGIQEKEQV